MAPGHKGCSEFISALDDGVRAGAGLAFSLPLLSPYVPLNVGIFKVQNG